MRVETKGELRERNRDLEARLEEAEATLRAIRAGEVDAVVVSGPDGDVVYTLEGADEGYRLLVERMAEGAATLNPDGLILFANQQFAAMLGMALQQVIGCMVQDFVPPEARPLIESVMAARDGSHSEMDLRAGDGHLVPAYLSAAPLHWDEMECISLVVTDLTEHKRTLSDISELRRAQEALRESEARERAGAAELRAIMEAAPVAVFVANDPECREIIGNRAGQLMLRVPPGHNTSKSAPPGEAPTNFRILRNGHEVPGSELPVQQAAATGRNVLNDEVEIVFEDGTRRSVLGNAVPLLGEDNRPRGAVGAFLDITERKRSQERLGQAQKLESIGLLAGGIAHDFNNLMTGILGNASLVLEDVQEPVAERLRDIITCAERAADLTRQLLAYSGKGQFIAQDLNVAETVQQIGGLVQFSIPKSVQLSVAAETRLPPVRMDPGQLQQILMNLVINAGEAIGEGHPGRINLVTSLAEVEDPFIDALGEEVPPGRYVTVSVDDTGEGMGEQKLSRIFDPFFTTKFTGRGLGLAAVAGILRSLKGGITVSSEPGGGSTFRAYLPAAVRREEWAGREEEAAQGACPTVLVVDDEPSVRDLIDHVLRRRGYRVLLASDGAEAVAVCDREAGKIDLAIVDVLMPRMGAHELLPILAERRPQTKVLLTSGYSEPEARRLSAAYRTIAFIQKPYSAQQIAEAVEMLVPARRGKQSDTAPR